MLKTHFEETWGFCADGSGYSYKKVLVGHKI